MAAWRYEISLRVLKNISLFCCAHSSNRNFVSPRGHAISSIYARFWGVDKVHNGLCENSELNSRFNNSPLLFKYLQPQSQEKILII